MDIDLEGCLSGKLDVDNVALYIDTSSSLIKTILTQTVCNFFFQL